MSNSELTNCIRDRRIQRQWSQQELAERAGIARASVSAIETGRLVPSTAAALSLSTALGCRVEDLFQLKSSQTPSPQWAWPPVGSGPHRFWTAEVGGRHWLFPADASRDMAAPHDGVQRGGALERRCDAPPPTLVLASCDPAAKLLAAEVARTSGVRLLVFFRSSRAALALLKQGLVHAAGLHLDRPGGAGNVDAVRDELGSGYRLIRAASWEEGVAAGADPAARTLRGLLRAKTRWVAREPGSGARQCLDSLLGPASKPRRLAADHRGVAEAVRSGWADAGVCPRIVAEEAGLTFFSVRDEAYDVCFAESLADDPRIAALVSTLQSASYRRQIDDLPGYNGHDLGHAASV
jgi:molybdate-binding protein/DNA-binding XRE family transcriptional regulator